MDWDNYRPDDKFFEKPPPSTTLKYFKIGFGFTLGLVAAWLIYMLVVGSIVIGAVKEVQTSTVANVQNASLQIQAQLQAQQQRLREQEDMRKAQVAREKAELQRLQYEAMMREKAEREMKEAAWERFYQKRVECENPNSNDQFVECTNEYMRAKARFEKEWASKNHLSKQTANY